MVLPEAPLRFGSTDRERFFFRGASTCRLCGVSGNPKEHLTNGTEARYHVLREAVAGSLLSLSRRGVNVNQIVREWPSLLLRNPHFERIRSIIPDTLMNRAGAVHQQLLFYKSCGILDEALAPATREGQSAQFTKKTRNGVCFERAEFIGDAMWGSETNRRLAVLFPQQRWLSNGSAWALGMLRDGVESNLNQMQLFDCLGISRLLPPDVLLTGDKPQADILEAIGGALHLALMQQKTSPPSISAATLPLVTGHSLATLLQHTLTELIDLAVLVFLFALIPRVLPFVHELAAAEKRHDILPAILSERALRLKRRSKFSFLRLQVSAEPSRVDGPQPPAVTSDINMLYYRIGTTTCLKAYRVLLPPLTKLRGSPMSPVRQKFISNHEVYPRLQTDEEMMIARMYPLNVPFAINSGYVPDIIKRIEKRQKSSRDELFGGQSLKPNRIMQRKRRR